MCLTCGHIDCLCHYELQKKPTDIPHSSLPPLPAGWCGPWEVLGNYVIGQYKGKVNCHICYCGAVEARFFAALLNFTHPTKGSES